MMRRPGLGDSPRPRLAAGRRTASGQPTWLGTTGDFSAGVGRHIDSRAPRGYYIDLSSKATTPDWPPGWYRQPYRRPYVGVMQWGLACFERHLADGGEEWLHAALKVGDHLLEIQERDGRHRGGWVQRFPYRHTYHVSPPWLSAMVQGEGASLLIRLHGASGDERYAEAAILALAPMRHPTSRGGVVAGLGDGFFPQEYPTDPPAHVLNGGVFALWGCYDVGTALGDGVGRDLAAEGIATLAGSLDRWDTGNWSRYDLFPHPVLNVATPVYHRLHTDQLRAMAIIDSDPRFTEVARRFEHYAESGVNVARALGRKALFRLAVPRNRWLAFRLPWTRRSGR